MELLTSFCLCFLKNPVRQDGVYGAVTKLPQIRYVAYLTMVLYFIYAAIEYHQVCATQPLSDSACLTIVFSRSNKLAGSTVE